MDRCRDCTPAPKSPPFYTLGRPARRALPLDATELVHEVFLRLVEQRQLEWQSRDQFFAISARLVRRILVDEARRRLRSKRGTGAIHLALEQVQVAESQVGVEMLALDNALTQLAVIRASAAKVVELRFFAGMSIDETATALGLGRATVIRTWRFARTWLTHKLAESP